jgi:hypothetical protein
MQLSCFQKLGSWSVPIHNWSRKSNSLIYIYMVGLPGWEVGPTKGMYGNGIIQRVHTRIPMAGFESITLMFERMKTVTICGTDVELRSSCG